jgi:mannose-6-phosphate isomerase-like protein (cupin superfamily)
MTGFPATTDLLAAADALTDYWSPRIVAQVNDQYVKVAKLRGSFVWHAHEFEDELFYVLRGSLRIEYEDRPAVDLPAGSIHVVPRNVRHNPVAAEECAIVLIEPVATRHTGDTPSPLSKTIDQQLAR